MASLKKLVATYVSKRKQAKQLYQEADAVFALIVDKMEVGDIVKVGDVKYELVNNFAETNVCFRAHGIRRLELREVKK